VSPSLQLAATCTGNLMSYLQLYHSPVLRGYSRGIFHLRCLS
jgi:hypothetical protein